MAARDLHKPRRPKQGSFGYSTFAKINMLFFYLTVSEDFQDSSFVLFEEPKNVSSHACSRRRARSRAEGRKNVKNDVETK